MPDETAAWYKKSLHGAWHKGMSEVADIALLYQWLNRSNIRANTETLIMAAQEQAPHTIAVACELHHTGAVGLLLSCHDQSLGVCSDVALLSHLYVRPCLQLLTRLCAKHHAEASHTRLQFHLALFR